MPNSMFDPFSPISDALQKGAAGLLSASDNAIKAMCTLMFGQIFAAVAVIVIGWQLLQAVFDDDIVGGVKKTMVAIIPLMICAWLINPKNGCQVVKLKNDVVALQAVMVSTVASNSNLTLTGNLVSDTKTITGSAGNIFDSFMSTVWEGAAPKPSENKKYDEAGNLALQPSSTPSP